MLRTRRSPLSAMGFVATIALFTIGQLSGLLAGVAKSPTVPEEKSRFHLFLLAGQSNMAGRGKVEKIDQVSHPRVLTLDKEGKWVPAVDPIHFDKPGAGVGPGRAFGLAIAEMDPDIVIGLIPCAVGGSNIASWRPGEVWSQTNSRPYDDAIQRGRAAMRDGTLKAILWHQGESDGKSTYKDSLQELIERFRVAFDELNLPFLIGQLGKFPERPWTERRIIVDEAHQAVADEDENVVFVTSEGLTAKSDNVHFNAESARELGRRFARAYLEFAGESQ